RGEQVGGLVVVTLVLPGDGGVEAGNDDPFVGGMPLDELLEGRAGLPVLLLLEQDFADGEAGRRGVLPVGIGLEVGLEPLEALVVVLPGEVGFRDLKRGAGGVLVGRVALQEGFQLGAGIGQQAPVFGLGADLFAPLLDADEDAVEFAVL